MLKSFKVLLLLLGSIIISLNSFAQDEVHSSSIIDLTSIDWEIHKPIKIEGYFDFYWNQLVDPTDTTTLQKGLLAKLPGSWTNVKLTETEKLPADGFASYQVKIKVPNEDEVYGLKMYSVFSSFKLFQDDVLIAQVGTIAKQKEGSVANFKTLEIPIEVDKKGSDVYQDITLTFQVSNFFHRRAGLQKPMFIAPMEKIIGQTKDAIVLNLLLIGIILVIGINHVLMYIMRRLDISNLMFGLLCVIMILRNVTTGERILLHWFPNMDWELLVRLDNFSGFATIALFAFFFYFQFRTEFPKIMFYIIMGIGSLITLLVFSSSAWFYGQFRMVFELYILLGGLYLTFGVLLRAAIKGREGSLISFIGMFLLYATAINDVLSSMGLIQTAFVAPYGLATFLMFQSFLLTRKSASALKDNQKLSKELADEKQSLEDRINARTKELTSQANELEIHKLQQEKQNWINESINLVSEEMRNNKDNIELLADSLLSMLVKRMNAHLGALYFLKNKKLKLLAQYGLSKDAIDAKLDTREGLTGKVFTEANATYMEELPDDFFTISSGLGNAKPKALALVPMIVDEKVVGVIELATFKSLPEEFKEFLEKIAVSIGAQINILNLNAGTKTLLDDLQSQEQEFREAQMELIVLRERLEIEDGD